MSTPPRDEYGRSMVSRSRVCKILGLSRKALRYYDMMGICKPAFIDPSNRYHFYSTDQLPLLAIIKLATDMGASISDFKEIIGPSGNFSNTLLLDTALSASLLNMQHARRALKNASRCREMLADTRVFGERDDYYLRYIPQRWCGCIALGNCLPPSLGHEETALRFGQLRRSASSFGWATTMLAGSLFSTPLAGDGGSGYLYVELSSPAMPEPEGAKMIDSGCYKAAGIVSGKCAGHKPPDCAACGRLGDGDFPAELLSEEDRSAFVLMEGDMGEPYLSGDWASRSRKVLSAQRQGIASVEEQALVEDQDAARLFPQLYSASQGKGDRLSGSWQGPLQSTDPHAPAYRPTPARKPMLMPLTSYIPGGVTAALIPAGVYLCKQHHSQDDSSAALAEFMAFARTIPRHKLTRSEEYRLHLRDKFRDFHPNAQDGGPAPVPFGESRIVADTRKRGWFLPLDEAQGKVEVVTNTGLRAGDDVCLVDAFITLDTQNDASLRETQLLVYTPLLPEL